MESSKKPAISSAEVKDSTTVVIPKIAQLLNQILSRVQHDCFQAREEDHRAALKHLENLLKWYPKEVIDLLLEKLTNENDPINEDEEQTELLLFRLKEIIKKSAVTVNISLYHFLKRDFLFSDSFKSIWSLPKNKPDTYAKKRNEIEEQILGYSGPTTWRMNIQAEALSRPIYGAINYADHPLGAAPDYGAVVLQLDPDIIYRATITPCDSFYMEELPTSSKNYLDCIATINFLDRIISLLNEEQLKYLIIYRFLEKKFDTSAIVEMPPIETQILGGLTYERGVTAIYIALNDCLINQTRQPGFHTVSAEHPEIASNLMLFGYKNNLNIYLVDDQGSPKLFYQKGTPIDAVHSILSTQKQFDQQIAHLHKAFHKFKYRKIKHELQPIFKIAELLDHYQQFKTKDIEKRLHYLEEELLPTLVSTKDILLNKKFSDNVKTIFEQNLKKLAAQVAFEMERLKLAQASQNTAELKDSIKSDTTLERHVKDH